LKQANSAQYIAVSLSFLCIGVRVVLLGCRHTPEADRDLAPLVVSKDAPPLLDAPAEPEKITAASAENAACFVCHDNYRAEDLVALHASADIGCTKCHGKSYPHRNDENHTTAPDRMFPAESIVEFCKTCHEAHEIEPAKLKSVRETRTDKPESDPVVCTDCHGRHRLARRTARWDKKSGRFIPSDGL